MKVLSAWSLWPESPGAGSSCPGTQGADRRVADLAPLEERFVAQRLRRVGRHARLALVGAAACLRESGLFPPGDRTGMYLGSGIGNAAEESLVVEQVVGMILGVTTGPSSPVHFANSVSNSATFYAARVTGVTGPNLVVSQEEVSFEGALWMAELALREGEIDFALVGGVDEAIDAREGIYLRIDLPPETVLGEGSGWLLVAREGDDVLGEILRTVQVPGGARAGDSPPDPWDRLQAEVAEVRAGDEPLFLLPGLRIDADDLAALGTRFPGSRVAPYLDRSGSFATAAALGITGLFRPGVAEGLYLHVTRCRIGVAAVLIRRHPDPARKQPCG